jgi:hypothetical protein
MVQYSTAVLHLRYDLRPLHLGFKPARGTAAKRGKREVAKMATVCVYLCGDSFLCGCIC